MQQKSQVLALAMALGLAAMMPGLAQPQPTEPTRPPERVAPGAAPTTPELQRGANVPQPGTAAPTPRSEASTTATPAPGANSFTESQARSRIEAAGFTQVSGLVKQDDGIWRAEAMRGASRVTVMLDYRGDVSSR